MSALTPTLPEALVILEQSRHLGVVTCCPERVLSANDAFLRMIGFTREELDAGLVDWRTITLPEYLVRDEQAIHELRDFGVCVPFEKEYLLRDGTRLPVLLGAVRHSLEPLEWVCWVTDLSAHNERENAEARSHQLAEELKSELRGANLISEINTRLLSKASVPELLTEILDAAIELTQASGGTVLLAVGKKHQMVAHRGFSREFVEFFESIHKNTHSACGEALRTNSRVIVEDVATDPMFEGGRAREVVLGEGMRAVQSTPLVSASGEVYGVFSTHFRAPGRPSERSLRFLDLLAARASQILESLQYSEERRRAEGLRAAGELANQLAHEINNPVQALTNLLALLSQNSAVTADGQPLVKSAVEQLERVSATVRKMLAVEFAPVAAATMPKLVEHMSETRASSRGTRGDRPEAEGVAACVAGLERQ